MMKKMKFFIFMSVVLVGLQAQAKTSLSVTQAAPKATAKHPVVLSLTQPVIKASPYHQPYVAVWLETPKRKGVTTITLWYQTHNYGEKSDFGKTWLKDLRQWWRKVGRVDQAANKVDGYAGATRVPKTYLIKWDGKTTDGKKVAAGDYWLNVEAAREDGGRNFIRQKITLGKAGTATLNATQEIGPVSISWK